MNNQHTPRTIQSVVYGSIYDMGGFPVRQAFPSSKITAPDPFLLIHHAHIKVPSNIPVHKAGVGPHPHRGFSPVTFIFKGGVHHRDSRGNNNVVYEGGIQWMNAGMGIVHSERPPQDIHDLGGEQELIQLWVNSPSAHKMDQPQYFPFSKDEVTQIISEDGLVEISVFSGKLDNVSGPVPTLSEVNTYTVNLKKGGYHFFEFSHTHNAFLYLLDGKIQVEGDSEIDAHFAVVFNKDGDGIGIRALEDTRLIIGTGQPLEEPIVSHGPFVMNTETQIMEAFRDYQQGKLGILIED